MLHKAQVRSKAIAHVVPLWVVYYNPLLKKKRPRKMPHKLPWVDAVCIAKDKYHPPCCLAVPIQTDQLHRQVRSAKVLTGNV